MGSRRYKTAWSDFSDFVVCHRFADYRLSVGQQQRAANSQWDAEFYGVRPRIHSQPG
ncbi:hypothetical protein PL11201_210015 [Planktothrix sp. PCC 11201]|nr:hypothetical protein PL11201_210015 [Planktothrix sp. PCC 11201]